MTEHFLCKLDDLDEPGSLGFAVDLEGDNWINLFLVRRDDQVHAYENRCPHVGAPLEWQPDRFLDPEGSFIQCAMHGAIFEIETGHCVSGPCAGQGLRRLPLLRRDEGFFLDAANIPASQADADGAAP